MAARSNGFPEVSVVVPVHRGGDAFRLCLESLARAQPPPREVIAVLDGEDAGDAAIAAAHAVRAVPCAGPAGPALARNRGAAQARGEIVLFIDADVSVQPDAIDKVARAFRDDPDLAALFGSYDERPAADGVVSQFRNLAHHWVHQQACTEAFTFWAACGAIRREVFAAIGGFDESYRRPAIEDIELGERLAAAGRRVIVCKDLQVKHHKRWSLAGMLRTDFFDRGLPWTALILERGQARADLNLAWSQRISVLASGLLAACLLAAPFFPLALLAAAAALLVLIAANASFYRFLLRRRGLRFALIAVPLHALHFLAGGLAFAAGLARHLWRRLRGARAPE